MASSIASERKAQSDRLRLQTVARTLCDRPAQTDEARSARCDHHEAMRNVRRAPAGYWARSPFRDAADVRTGGEGLAAPT